jgi:hypothetical protein
MGILEEKSMLQKVKLFDFTGLLTMQGLVSFLQA